MTAWQWWPLKDFKQSKSRSGYFAQWEVGRCSVVGFVLVVNLWSSATSVFHQSRSGEHLFVSFFFAFVCFFLFCICLFVSFLHLFVCVCVCVLKLDCNHVSLFKLSTWADGSHRCSKTICIILCLLMKSSKCQNNIQGVFFTGTPPKSSKYKKVNLG